MNDTSNNIFFATLRQYTHDSAAGAAIVAAVEKVCALADFDRERILGEDSESNLRWFSRMDKGTQEQVIALTSAVKNHMRKTAQKELRESPARINLESLKIAVHIYRFLSKKNKVVAEVVANTTINNREAYKAIIRTNYALIQNMRNSSQKTRSWNMIARALDAICGKKIPASALSRLTKEIEEELRARASEPRTVSHYVGERLDDNLKAAYQKAGYVDSSPASERISERVEAIRQ